MKIEELMTIDEAESKITIFIMMSRPTKTQIRNFISKLDCIVGHDERVEIIREKIRYI